MLLINCKVELSLKWIENCVLTTAEIGANADATGADNTTLDVTDAKFYVPVVTLSAEGNVKLVQLLKEGFKRLVYWNKYKVIHNKIVEIAAANAEKHITELLDLSYQRVKSLFLLIQQIISKYLLTILKNISFQGLKLKITTSKMTEEIFMISQLMTRLSNTTKSEKYQQDKMIIRQLVVSLILLILKKTTD